MGLGIPRQPASPSRRSPPATRSRAMAPPITPSGWSGTSRDHFATQKAPEGAFLQCNAIRGSGSPPPAPLQHQGAPQGRLVPEVRAPGVNGHSQGCSPVEQAEQLAAPGSATRPRSNAIPSKRAAGVRAAHRASSLPGAPLRPRPDPAICPRQHHATARHQGGQVKVVLGAAPVLARDIPQADAVGVQHPEPLVLPGAAEGFSRYLAKTGPWRSTSSLTRMPCTRPRLGHSGALQPSRKAPPRRRAGWRPCRADRPPPGWRRGRGSDHRGWPPEVGIELEVVNAPLGTQGAKYLLQVRLHLGVGAIQHVPGVQRQPP